MPLRRCRRTLAPGHRRVRPDASVVEHRLLGVNDPICAESTVRNLSDNIFSRERDRKEHDVAIAEGFPSGLDALIHPVPVEEFFSTWYGVRPLVIADATPGRRLPAFSVEDAAAFIESLSLEQGSDYLVVKDGVDQPELFVKSKLRRDGLLSCLENPRLQWSWVATGVHRYVYPLCYQAHRLSDHLKSEVFTNAYFTPAAARCFKTHSDPHDVLVWQLSGRKAWRVYAPGGQKDVPIVEHVLEPGQVLYVPEGCPHAADACADAPSLHLTVGFYSRPSVVRRLLHQKLQQWASPVPVELLDRLPRPNQIVRRNGVTKDEVWGVIDAWRGWLDAELTGDDFPGARPAHHLPALDPTSVIRHLERLTPGGQCAACDGSPSSRPDVAGRELGWPEQFIVQRPGMAGVMATIGSLSVFGVHDLRMDDPQRAQSVFRSLVAAGLARVVD